MANIIKQNESNRSMSTKEIWQNIHANSELVKQSHFLENIYPSKCAQSFHMFHVKPSFENHKTINFLDIGCGSGTNLELFTGNNYLTTGIDISPAAIELASKRYRDLAKFHIAESTKLPIESNSQDFILADCSLCYCQTLNDYSKSVDEMFRVLKPGGQARIYDHADDDLMVSSSNIKSDQIYYSKSKWESSMPTICLREETIFNFYSKFSKILLGREIFNHINSDKSKQHSFWIITVTK